jgi:phage shock protein C
MAKKIALSSNKKLAGVCGGVAEYLGIDPTIVRILWVVFTFCGGAGLLAYIICWILFPKA